jgi:hypothetical protein
MRTFHATERGLTGRRRGALAILATTLAIAFLGSSPPLSANLVIVPTFDSSITGDPNAAAIEGVINGAISDYEARFTDPITVAIQFHEMGSGLGESSTFFQTISYNSFITALHADATTANDAIALSHLPITSTNPVNGSDMINVATANLRAVGLPGAPPPGQPDGLVGLNTHITFPGSPGSSLTYSLRVVTQHEIDEVLGLGSALPNPPQGTIFPQDLFRYDGSGHRSFAQNSGAAYFSLDSTTRLAQFNNTNNGGDYGDWQSSPHPPGVPPQVQDAFATPHATPTLGVELTALDVIGYDLSTVPEPSTLAIAGLGGALCLGYAVRRRQAKR